MGPHYTDIKCKFFFPVLSPTRIFARNDESELVLVNRGKLTYCSAPVAMIAASIVEKCGTEVCKFGRIAVGSGNVSLLGQKIPAN